MTTTRPAPLTAERKVEFSLLVVSGLLTGIGTAAFAMYSIGPVWVPFTAVIAGVVNWVLIRLASSYTMSGWRFAPLAAWAVPVIAFMLPLFGPHPLLFDLPLLLLIVFGAGAPAVAAFRSLPYGHA